jgi:hypothetical protein
MSERAQHGQRPVGRDWQVTGLLVAAYALALALGAVVLLPERWLIWAGVVVLGLALLVGWHAHRFAYRCTQCGTVFSVSALADFVSPQGLTRGPTAVGTAGSCCVAPPATGGAAPRWCGG